MRQLVWYVAFSIAVGAVLYAFLPVLVPWYVVIAVVGGSLALADMIRRGTPGRPREEAMQRAVMASPFGHDPAYVDAAVAFRQKPWYADTLVDPAKVGRRLWIERNVPNSLEILANPYFVLPLAKLVEWGFATDAEVREAVRVASLPVLPVYWRNPAYHGVLTMLGWSDAEAYARIGLWAWSSDEARQTLSQSAQSLPE